jgi:hypothetical protein
MNPIQLILPFGALATIYPMSNAGELGDTAFWRQLIDQLYAQMPFSNLFAVLRFGMYHMDHPEQRRMALLKKACLIDYDPIKEGKQTAAGLYEFYLNPNGENLTLGAFPNPFTYDYTGSARPISWGSLVDVRKVASHEFGHHYFHVCRFGYGTDDAAKRFTERFRQYRPRQADNEHEDAAEAYRAVAGADDVRGTYSDNKPATISPELRSTVRCGYWFTANLNGAWVSTLTPARGGIMYQVFSLGGWKWRWLDENTFRSQEWDGHNWKPI